MKIKFKTVKEIFEKITLDGRGFNKNAEICLCTHNDEDHEDVEVKKLFIPFTFKYTETFNQHKKYLNKRGIETPSFSDDFKEIAEGIYVRETSLKGVHAPPVELKYQDYRILVIGDLDIGDIPKIYYYVKKRFSKIHAVILPYYGLVKPPAHGVRSKKELHREVEKLARDITRDFKIKVFFFQHFTKLPRNIYGRINSRLIPRVHKTLKDIKVP